MHFGATLRLLRTSAGVSLTGLATRVGVSPAYLSRVEHGHDAPPTPDRLRAIAAALGLPADALPDLVGELRPEATEWLARTAGGRQLAAEMRRRGLGGAQIARITEFVCREFPLSAGGGGAASLFAEARILHAVSVPTLQDALDIATLRLVERAELGSVAAELSASAGHPHGPPPCAIGGGLCLAHARASGQLRGVLLLLSQPLETPAPDGLPIRAITVLVGPDEAALAGGLVRAARLACAGVVTRLCATASAADAFRVLRELEGGAAGL